MYLGKDVRVLLKGSAKEPGLSLGLIRGKHLL